MWYVIWLPPMPSIYFLIHAQMWLNPSLCCKGGSQGGKMRMNILDSLSKLILAFVYKQSLKSNNIYRLRCPTLNTAFLLLLCLMPRSWYIRQRCQ